MATSDPKQAQRPLVPTSPIPEPVAPVNGATVPNDHVQFRWSDPDGMAPAYYVEIAGDAAFTNVLMVVLVQAEQELHLRETLHHHTGSLYWRVRRQEGGRWSKEAHFEAVRGESATAAPPIDAAPAIPASPAAPVATNPEKNVAAPKAVTTNPQPIAPIAGASVEGSAATFEWHDPKGSKKTTYRIQIARDAAFERDVLDVQAGRTTVFSLMGILPEDGSELHWRVGREQGTATDWSEPAVCKVVTEADVIADRVKQEQAEVRRAYEAVAKGGEIESGAEWRSTHTSSGFAMATILFMAITFLAFILVLVATRIG